MRYEPVTVVGREQLGDGHFVLELASMKPLPEIRAGQFINLRCIPGDQHSLLRPFSVLDVDDPARTIFVYVKVLGRLSSVLSSVQIGASLDCLYPLGNGFEWNERWMKVALVGGGVGIAPLLFMAKQIASTNVNCKLAGYFGGRSESDLVPKLLENCSFEMHLATDDGTCGHQGTVVDLFGGGNNNYDVVYTCGPNPMMAALKGRLGGDQPAFASLEEYMACGVGACLGCVAQIEEDGGVCNKPVCKDGPVFDLHKVVF